MKTKKIYEKPMCEVVGPATEDLCDSDMGIHASYADFQGAKEAQSVFDDEAEENPEYDL